VKLEPRYKLDLIESLQKNWDLVSEMDVLEARELFGDFSSACINLEFVDKLLRQFESRRPIGDRFFKEYVGVDSFEELRRSLHLKSATPIDVEVLWDGFKNPVAYNLSGYASSLDSVFLYGGDAISRVRWDKMTIYLFFSGHTHEIRAFVNNAQR